MHEIKDIKVAVIKENGTKKYQPRIENYVDNGKITKIPSSW